MTDNSKKLSELPLAANAALTDRVLILRDPAGNPSSRTITVGNLLATTMAANTGDWTWPLLNGGYTRAELGGSQNSYIEGQSPGGLILHNDYLVTLNANNSYWVFDSNGETPVGITLPAGASEIRTPHEPNSNTKYSLSYYDEFQWGGYTQLDRPGGNSSWAWVGTDISDIDNPWVVLEVRADDGSYTTWKFDSDLKRNGVSVIGTGQIDGGNAFTSPTAEITVDGGGA